MDLTRMKRSSYSQQPLVYGRDTPALPAAYQQPRQASSVAHVQPRATCARSKTGGWPSVGLAADLTEPLSFSARSAQPRLAPSAVRPALSYDLDGGMFDARVEGAEFHALAGSWISQVKIGERFTLPRRRLDRMIAKASNPAVPHTRSWARRGMCEIGRPRSEGRRKPEVRRSRSSASSPFRHSGIRDCFDWPGLR